MTDLSKLLHHKISQSGPTSISCYLQDCLMHPDGGYYQRQTVFGTEGDFITAPEISQIFGEMLAAFHAHIHSLFGNPSDVICFEAGPGKGTLAADMMRTYRSLSATLATAPLYLLEEASLRRAEQQQSLGDVTPIFINDLSDLPPKPLFGVANEFFDALGVDQIIWQSDDRDNANSGTQKSGKWHHRLIDSDGEAFSFVIGPALNDDELADYAPLPDHPESGDILEVSRLSQQIIAKLAHHIAHYGGALLVIDYGKTDNHGDSLQAVRHHKPVDILTHQGDADMTHWVDFAALANTASDHHARLIGPVPQGRFLLELGIGARAEDLRQTNRNKSDDQAPDADHDRQLLAAIDRLVSPAHMGQAFKIALLVPQGEGLPPGFSSLDPTGAVA